MHLIKRLFLPTLLMLMIVTGGTSTSAQQIGTTTLGSGGGENTSWSAIQSFNTLASVPEKPALIAPVNNAVFDVTSINFSWESFGESVAYQIQISDSSTFDNIIHQTEVFVAEYTHEFSLAISPTTFYWRVRVENTSGIGAWSDTYQFTIRILDPTTLLFPSHGHFASQATLEFSWTDVQNATHYQIQIATNSHFTNIIYDETVTMTNVTHTLINPASDAHYWRVRAMNQLDESIWSTVYAFFMRVPDAPAVVAPSTNMINATSVTFAWHTVISATSYQLQISTSQSFAVVLYDHTLTTNNHTQTFSQGGLYYWRVRAINQFGTSNWRPLLSFTLTIPTQTPPLSTPTLIWPTGGAFGNVAAVVLAIPNNMIDFVWSVVPAATQYQIQFFHHTSSDSSLPVYDYTVNTNHIQLSPELITYRWQVRAINSEGMSEWSSKQLFLIPMTPPGLGPTPRNTNNQNGEVNTPSVFVQWDYSNIDHTTAYQIQFSTNATFTNIIHDHTFARINSNAFAQMFTEDGIYYWRIRALNPFYIGPWSFDEGMGLIGGFNLRRTVPNTPVLNYPYNDKGISSIYEEFRWYYVDGGDIRYEIQFATNSTFTNNVQSHIPDIWETKYLKVFDASGTYYWRVRARNILGNGNWSAARSIRVYLSIPAAPGLFRPVNNAQLFSTPTEFRWNVSNFVTYNHIQIATDAEFNTIIHEATFDRDDFSTSLMGYVFTPPPGTYYWRVRAGNILGQSAWSGVYQFSVASSEVTTLSLPADGMITQNPTINFSWTPIHGVTSYTIEISAFDDFSVVPAAYRIATTNSSYTYIHNAHGTYYWRVQTIGSTEWSETRQFTLEPSEPLPQPTLIAPATGSNFVPINGVSVGFNWSTVSNPTPYQLNYYLEMATDENFTTIVYSGNRLPNQNFVLYGDQTVATYYWRVCARIEAIPCTNWSNVFEFTVQPMIQDTLIGPVDGYTSHSPAITFEITRVNDSFAVDRRIQVALDSNFTNFVTEFNVLSAATLKTFPPNTYYWRFRKSPNSVGGLNIANSWSETRQFTIEQYDTPILVSLPNNQINYGYLPVNASLYFEWLPVDDDRDYEFQIARDSTFDNIVVAQTTRLPSVTISQTMYAQTFAYDVYYWRVRAVYTNVNIGEWSEVRSFSVVNYNQNRGVTSQISTVTAPSDISGDGRYIVLVSEANWIYGIYVHDRVTNQNNLVSVNSQGVAGNLVSYGGAISDDGRYVVFVSSATNLVANDSGGWRDIFLHDRQTAQTRRVSVNAQGIGGDADSASPDISSDGRYVVFRSSATNLVPNDTNGRQDIFMYDVQTEQITLISASNEGVIGNQNSYYSSISNDGRYVLFMSFASNLIASDTDTNPDIYIKDMQTGELTLESLNHAGGKLTSVLSARIAGNGNHIVFLSDDPNASLTRYYTRGVYVRNRQTGEILPANIPFYPLPLGQIYDSNRFISPSISDDGRYVAFETSSDHVTPDLHYNSINSVYRHDMLTAETLRMAISTDGVVGNGASFFSGYNWLSGDGNSGVFRSSATNLIPNDINNTSDTFVIQFGASKPVLVSPTDNTIMLPQEVSFNWMASMLATEYQIQIASDRDFANVLYDANLATTTYTQMLTPNTYYWRVLATNSWGDGAWSDVNEFTIAMLQNISVDEQQLFNMAQSRLPDDMTFALFDITPTGIITTVQFSDGGVVTGTITMSITNGLVTIMVDGVSGGSAEQQIAFYDVMPAFIMAMFDEALPDEYELIESLILTDVGISANLLMPNNP